MFRPKNPTPPTNLRLPKLHQNLGTDELNFLVGEASKKRGTTIELPFRSGPDTYMLTVKCSDESYEPVWSYYRGDDDNAQMLWRHSTGDINLLQSLVASASDGHKEAAYITVSPGSVLPNQQPGAPPPMLDPSSTLQNIKALSTTTGGGKTATLEGDLSNMQIPTLLQSINMSRMTGCLRLTNQGNEASIWFDDGNPVHALTAETAGDPAIVELITWEDGDFHFYPNEKTSEKTVKRRVDGLLMEGVTLLDQNKFIKDRGVKAQSYLIRTQERITEEEFRQALMKGAPLDFEKQKRFYSQIDNASTLFDVLRRMPMIKNEWVPLMFNMLACGLVTASDTPPVGVTVKKILDVPPFEIDRAAIAQVNKTLTRQETGIFTYPAFTFMLEREFSKCASLGIPLSLVIFEPCLRTNEGFQALPQNIVLPLLRKIESVKRPFDTLGHFETFEFGLFLPNTQTMSARVFMVRLIEMLASDPSMPRSGGQVTLVSGIASAPEDTMDLPVLISAAREGKRSAKETGTVVTTCRELGSR